MLASWNGSHCLWMVTIVCQAMSAHLHISLMCRVEPFSGQHRSENPRQMMLGCKKGVKWYGSNTWEHLFKDEVCEGSQLRFLCEYSIASRAQAATHMRLWL